MAATKELITITVDGINPRNGGVLDTNGTWYSISKFSKDVTPSLFTKGTTYTVEIGRGKTGGVFITGVVGSAKVEAQTAVEKQFDENMGKKVATDALIGLGKLAAPVKPPSNGMSKADWAEKDKNMQIGGMLHDVATVFAALSQSSAIDSSHETMQRAVELVVKARETLTEKLA